MKSQIEFPMHKAMQELTLEVEFTGVTAFKVRAWIAVQLVKLASLVLGCKVEIKDSSRENFTVLDKDEFRRRTEAPYDFAKEKARGDDQKR